MIVQMTQDQLRRSTAKPRQFIPMFYHETHQKCQVAVQGYGHILKYKPESNGIV